MSWFRLSRCRSCSIPLQKAAGNQELQKAMHIRIPFQSGPIEPTDLVVLAKGIVVAALVWRTSSPIRIIGTPEGESMVMEKEVLHLTVTQPFDPGIVARALNAAIPTPVVVRPIAVPLSIRLRYASCRRTPDRSG